MLTQLPHVDPVEAIEIVPVPADPEIYDLDSLTTVEDPANLSQRQAHGLLGQHVRLIGPAEHAWSVLHLDTYQNLIVDAREYAVVSRAKLAYEHRLPVKVAVTVEQWPDLDDLDRIEKSGPHARADYGLFTLLDGTISADPAEHHQIVVDVPRLGTVELRPIDAQAILIRIGEHWYGHL